MKRLDMLSRPVIFCAIMQRYCKFAFTEDNKIRCTLDTIYMCEHIRSIYEPDDNIKVEIQ